MSRFVDLDVTSPVRPSSPRGVHPNACRAWHPVHTNYTSFHVSVVVVDDYYYHHRPTANSPRNASINVANSNRAEFQSRSTIASPMATSSHPAPPPWNVCRSAFTLKPCASGALVRSAVLVNPSGRIDSARINVRHRRAVTRSGDVG